MEKYVSFGLGFKLPKMSLARFQKEYTSRAYIISLKVNFMDTLAL
ncbi:MAG: hypothetical protein ABGX00_09830 [Allomuricauda sp.]